MANSTNVGRIMKEIEDLKTKPEDYFSISVSETNIMDWYIKYKNLSDSRFTDGEYILHIKLHEGYPFKAPDFKWLTPNGRFEINTKICYNISTYHEGEWNPLWRMRTIIIGILSMLLETETSGIGHLRGTTQEKYIELSNKSIEFNKKLGFKFFDGTVV
jgi:ubiquitin-protein ligase